MLRDKTLFKILWRLINFCGLQPHKLVRIEKIRTILFFVLLVSSNFILHIVEIILNIDIMEVRLNVLQTLPTFIQIIWECLNFSIKSKKIKEIFAKLDELFVKIDEKDFLNRGYSSFRIYFIINAIVVLTSCIGGIFYFGLTGKTPVLIYKLSSTGIGFFLTWLLQSIFLLYSCVMIYLTDQLLISLLIFLSFYLKALRRKIQTKKISELSEIIQLHLEFKR